MHSKSQALKGFNAIEDNKLICPVLKYIDVFPASLLL